MQKKCYKDKFAYLDPMLFKPHELSAHKDLEEDEEDRMECYGDKEDEETSSSEEELPTPPKVFTPRKKPAPMFMPPTKENMMKKRGKAKSVADWPVSGVSGVAVSGVQAIAGPSGYRPAGPVIDPRQGTGAAAGGAGDTGQRRW